MDVQISRCLASTGDSLSAKSQGPTGLRAGGHLELDGLSEGRHSNLGAINRLETGDGSIEVQVESVSLEVGVVEHV